MQTCVLVSITLGLVLPAADRDERDRPGRGDRGLAGAVRKTAALRSYSFQIDERPGQGTGGTVQGRYEKGKPVLFQVDGITFYRQAEALAYRDGGRWQRSKTGRESDPLRILGAAAQVRGARLPHEELPLLLGRLQRVKTAGVDKDGLTAYAGNLDREGAQELVLPAFRPVARGGQARVWVTRDNRVCKYTFTIRVQGRLGNADVDGQVTKTVVLSNPDSAQVTIPEGARKALE